jgi:hypothetical protein
MLDLGDAREAKGGPAFVASFSAKIVGPVSAERMAQ